jgi:FSR family fosmidomycin resistance protein-like MFS transporter
MNQEERKILFFASGAHFFTHFYILMFPALVMPLTRQLRLPLAEVVNIGFWMYMLYGMLALVWGWISDHWGHKYAMAAGMIVAGGSLALAGFVNGRVGITLAFAAVGAGCSAYHPAGTALVSQGIRERGRALGITGIWGSVGMASVPFTVGFLTYTLGWQTALLILGSLGLLLGIGSLVVPLRVDRQQDRKVVQKLENQAAAKLFLILLVSMLFSGLMYRSFTVILPAFMESRLGQIGARISSGSFFGKDSEALKTLAANTLTTLVYVLAIAGQAVGGRVADRFSLKWAYFLYFCAALPFVLGLAFLSGGALAACAAGFVFFVVGMQPVENSLVAFITPTRWRSVSYGAKFTLVFGAGSLAVRMVGRIESAFGLNQVVWLIAGFLLMAIASNGLLLLAARGRDLRH